MHAHYLNELEIAERISESRLASCPAESTIAGVHYLRTLNMSVIEWDDYEELPQKLQHYGKIFNTRFRDPRSTLYQEQKDALDGLVKWFSDPQTRDLTAVVVMPTGSGKTGVICCLPYTIGAAIEEKEIASGQINLNKSILMITPSLTIQQQLKEDLSKEGFLRKRGLLIDKDIAANALYTVRTVANSSAVTALKGGEAEIILSNSQKWRKQKDGTPTYQDLPKDLFSMVIVDEAHHLPAPQWEEIVEQFREYAKIVFFTATPIRADGKEITTDGAINTKGYAYELSRKIAIDQKLIRKMNITELEFQSDEYIDCIPPPTKRTRPASLDQLEEAPPQSEKTDLKAQLRMHFAKEVLVEVKKRLAKKNMEKPLPGNKKHAAIVIAKDIAEATKVRALCLSLDFKVMLMHSNEHKKPTDKENAIKEIKSGKVEIVIVVKMLLEGFDYPPLSVAGILRSIRSPVTFAQFIGRVQRRVNHKDDDGTITWEDGVVADVITHSYFKQKKMYDDYINPRINVSDENKDLDDDEIAKPEKHEDKTVKAEVKAEENINGAVKAEKIPMTGEY